MMTEHINQKQQVQNEVQRLRQVINHYNQTGIIQYTDESTLMLLTSQVKKLIKVQFICYFIFMVTSLYVKGNMMVDLFPVTILLLTLFLNSERLVVCWHLGQTVSKRMREQVIKEVMLSLYGQSHTHNEQDELCDYMDLVEHINILNSKNKHN